MDVSETRALTHGTHSRPVVADAQSDRAPPVQQPPKALPPTPGLAGGKDNWSKAPVSSAPTSKAPQAAGTPAKAGLRLAAIDGALAALDKAMHELEVAREKNEKARTGIPQQSTTDAQLERLAKAEAAAMLRAEQARLNLCEAIKNEAERLSAPSAFSPQAGDPA